MNIQRATLETCGTASGLAVTIDVIRAFTTAAFAFVAGVEDITLVSTIEEALELKRRDPRYILSGEVDGIPIEGFDYGNSPDALQGKDMKGVHFVQRTTCGTQGVVRAKGATEILVTGLCNVGATVRYIQSKKYDSITLIETGVRPDGYGTEDTACGDLIEGRLRGQALDEADILRRVRGSIAAGLFTRGHPAFPPQDMVLACDIDRFDFAMLVQRRDGLLITTPVYC